MTTTTIVYKGLFNPANIVATCDGDAMAERDELKQEVEQLRVQLHDIATSLHKRYYAKESPDFEPFDLASGLIGQIDNMVAGLLQDVSTMHAQLAEARGLLQTAAMHGTDAISISSGKHVHETIKEFLSASAELSKKEGP